MEVVKEAVAEFSALYIRDMFLTLTSRAPTLDGMNTKERKFDSISNVLSFFKNPYSRRETSW